LHIVYFFNIININPISLSLSFGSDLATKQMVNYELLMMNTYKLFFVEIIIKESIFCISIMSFSNN